MSSTSPRRLELLASNILFFGLAVAIADSLRTMLATPHKPLTFVMLGIGYLLFAGFYYGIRRGVTLIKWLFVLGQTATLLYSVFDYCTSLLPLLHTPFWTALVYVVFYGSRLVGAVLLVPTLRPHRPAVNQTSGD